MAEESEDPLGRVIATPTMALVDLLIDKGIITREEWTAAVNERMGEVLGEERLREIRGE